MRSLIFVALAVFGIGAVFSAPSADDELHKRKDEKYVSLIQLIADPDKFNGSNVSVGGYLVLSREYEHSIYLDEDANRSGMTANSIAISFDSSSAAIQKRAKELDRKYVIIAGRFKAGNTIFSVGELEDVYYIAPAAGGGG